MTNKILYIGDTEGVSGYSQSIRRVIFCLQDAGVDISAKYVKHDSNLTKDTNSLNRVRSLYGNQASVIIHQQIPHFFNPISRAYNIGFTMFETSKIPDEWKNNLNKMDEIWVPSQFNKNVFLKSGITKPIHVIRFPVDTDLYLPNHIKTSFRFLSVFQWTERKNWRALLEAYFREFSFSENVELYLKVYCADDSNYEKANVQNQIDSIIRLVANKNRPKYILDFSIKTEKELVELFQNSDIFVLPSRGEAVGLTYTEAMACGVPCIATGWGGQTEFINDSNGYLVEYELEPVDGMPHIKEYRRDQNWASVKIDDLRKQMRRAFSDKITRTNKSIVARKCIEEIFSKKSISKSIFERIGKVSKNTTIISIPPIKYRGDAFGLSGYSSAIRLMLKAINMAKIDIKLEPIFHDRKQIEPGIERDIINNLSKNPLEGTILIDHQTPEFFDTNGPQKYKIGVTYFETSKIPTKWVLQCNQMDEIWLPSEQTKQAFLSSGVKTKIEIIEPFLDTEHYSPNQKPWNIANKSSFVFLSVFEFTPRKGWDILVEAFAKSFRKTEDVCLVIKSHRNYPPMSENDIKQAIKNHLQSKNISEWPKILIYTDPIPYTVMPALYTAADVFVLPTRGESICYPAMEAMSCGRPAIITGDGGQMAFLNHENGYPIEFQTVPVKNFNHSPWYTDDQKMVEPDLNSLILTMRHVFSNRDEVKKKGICARRTMEFSHSVLVGSDKISKRLKNICIEHNL